MIYNFRDNKEFDGKRACAYLRKLIAEDNPHVEITAKRPRRTTTQNKYLHLILGWFAVETGNTIDYTKREYYKRICNAEIFVIKKFDNLLKCEVEVLRSSSDLTTAEMITTIERFRNWASAEAGIYLPAPNETENLQYLENEFKKYQNYL